MNLIYEVVDTRYLEETHETVSEEFITLHDTYQDAEWSADLKMRYLRPNEKKYSEIEIYILDERGIRLTPDEQILFIHHMDDELREEVHKSQKYTTAHEFIHEYKKRHWDKFDEEFVIN